MRRFIDDISGDTEYTSNYRLDHKGRMVAPKNWDPISPPEIVPEVDPPYLPKNIRPKPPTVYASYADEYDFDSSYENVLRYRRNKLQLAELNPNLASGQLSALQAWEELDVIWNSEISQFTNSSWNSNIAFVDDLYDGTITFGPQITQYPNIKLPGED